jgi:ATP-dependent Clp protease ATP-binding subunit ClpX
MENIELSFTSEALSAISEKAIQRKTGARGLRSILEGILLNSMFDLPGMNGVSEVVVNEEAVNGNEDDFISWVGNNFLMSGAPALTSSGAHFP